ncbi:MAG TPA: UDP-N-acetylmuramoyl-L-alanyl-D-glutamate--2,6-diaminopimelate ligase [Symbiobacteriaceae bacterium]|jgi:UDP-N-acetylmuramoyl-L-alanyl-D-glutamate--2,6-diaminopimelate ligase
MELATVVGLLPGCKTNQPPRGEINGLAYNSKTTKPGELFLCLRGTHLDGHVYAPEAVAQGAAGLVVERFLPLDVFQIQVADSRKALLAIGREFWGRPADRLGLVGVTGTNGKTTTTFYIRSVLQGLGRPVGLLGTVFNQVAGDPEPSTLTTPESLDLWQFLARAARERCDWVVMEVSSHALALNRVDPADFDIAVVTNITRDHFDYHLTYEHYWESKARMVREMQSRGKAGRPRAVILNADDPQVLKLARETDVPVVTFSLREPADVRATEVEATAAGSRFRLHLPGVTPTPVHLPLPGIFNVANALAAAAAGWVAGVELGALVRGLEDCRHVPGRAEIIDEGQDFGVIVDFAHNPDALAKVVTLRSDRPGGRTILVFGAEGGKDKGKRPEMGAAARGADYVIITSDNMLKEEPAEVARQIEAGVGDWPHEVILDRREAIGRALTLARSGDLVIIAGKGHEQTWVYGGERIAFDDRAVARETLRGLAARTEITPGG